MNTPVRRGGVVWTVAGMALVLAGLWMTLVRVLDWVLTHVMPDGVAATVARALLTVAGELVSRAWPLTLVALGAVLLAHGLLARRMAAQGRTR